MKKLKEILNILKIFLAGVGLLLIGFIVGLVKFSLSSRNSTESITRAVNKKKEKLNEKITKLKQKRNRNVDINSRIRNANERSAERGDGWCD
jgi:cell shape-determining protein MreC